MQKTGSQDAHSGNLLRSMTKAWPALPYLTYGVWLAWITLGISGTVWLSDVEINGERISQFYVVLCFACGVTCLLAAFFPRLSRRILNNNIALVVLICVAVLGGLITILVGPYYLEQYIGDTGLVHSIGFALMGIGSAAIFLKTGMLYGCLPPRKTLCYALYSQFVMVILCSSTFAAPTWSPVEGGPTLVGIVMFCFLPLLAAFLLLLPVNKKADDVQVCTYSHSARDLTSQFWRLMVLAFLIFFVTAMMQGGSVIMSSLAYTIEGTASLVLLRGAIAVVLLLVLLVFDIQRIKFGRVYTAVSVIVVVLLMCMPIFGAYSDITGFFIYLSSYVFEFAIFCLFSFLVYQKRISASVVFGFGQGISLIGVALGWMIGSLYLPTLMESGMSNLYIAIALVVLIAGVLLFSERSFDKLFATRSEREPSYESMMQAGIPISQSNGFRSGKFSDAVDAISSEYDLSNREDNVFRYLAMGRNASFIASKLYLSRNTVRTHIHNIYMKLDVHSQQELINLVESRTPHRDSLQAAQGSSDDAELDG